MASFPENLVPWNSSVGFFFLFFLGSGVKRDELSNGLRGMFLQSSNVYVLCFWLGESGFDSHSDCNPGAKANH